MTMPMSPNKAPMAKNGVVLMIAGDQIDIFW